MSKIAKISLGIFLFSTFIILSVLFLGLFVSIFLYFLKITVFFFFLTCAYIGLSLLLKKEKYEKYYQSAEISDEKKKVENIDVLNK